MNDEPLAPTDARRWDRRCLVLLACVLVARMVYLLIVPLDLISDESYYWDWSRRPAWGYYSKPPMVAWVIAGTTGLLGSTPFTVRLPAAVLNTVMLGVLYLLGRRLYDARVGFWTVVALLASPGGMAAGLLMTIDAPLLLFWTVSLYAVWRMLENDAGRAGWCALAVVATGLGLLSKQTMLALPALVGLFVLTGREDRRELSRPALWVWGLASAAFLIPFLWWNAHHEWITFEHTRHHFDSEAVGLGKRLAWFGDYVGGQFGIASPVTCLLGCGVVVACLAAFRTLPRRERFLFVIGGLPLFGVLALSMKQRVQPNWPAPFLVTTLLLTVAWAHGRFPAAEWWDRRRRDFPLALRVGAISAVLTLLVPFVVKPLGIAGHDLDPTDRLRGWSEFAARVERVRAELPDVDRTFLVTIGDRATTSELAFYLPDQPRVYRWTHDDRIGSQYELWPRPNEVGWDSLLVLPADVDVPEDLVEAYESLHEPRRVAVPLGRGTAREFDLYHARGFRGWPRPSPLAAARAARRG